MAFDKLGRFFGISEDDEMNEVPYTESEEQQEEIPQTQKNERRANVVSINSGVSATSKIVLYEHIKSPNAGCPELREALADYLCRSRGIVAAPEQIFVGAGAEYLYSMAAQLLGRERRFALESPCYEKIRLVYAANGLSLTALPLEEDGISSAALAACDAGVLQIGRAHV